MTYEEMFKDAGVNGKEFRGAPFWSWNDDLDPEELRRQVRSMCEAGMGGFFMHARNGLITPYLSQEYMDCHQACIDEAKKLGMDAWLYDEDCWPSGAAGNITPSKGKEYQAKWLLASDKAPGEQPGDYELVGAFALEKDGDQYVGYRRVSPQDAKGAEIVYFYLGHFGYIDVLSEEAVAQFIDSTHDAFKKMFGPEFGKSIPGMFTDEPNYHHTNWGQDFRQVPWTTDLPDEFRCRHSYDIMEKLPELYYEVGTYTKTRHDFWRTATELYVEAFSKQIGEWCEKEGIDLTGHYLLEDTLRSQTFCIGAAMPHYEYQQLPGIDHLCRRIADPILPKQVSSVSHQFGNRRVLSEMFGCCGWNMSFEDQKWIAEWQYVLGVNLMCQHLLLYSLKGCRKRDYPPSIFYQQPWWKDYPIVEDHFARLARALTMGKHVADVLVIHPMGSAWALYDPNRTDWHSGPKTEVDELSEEFAKLSQYLQEMHIDYDYGDESIMERHARVEDGRIVIGDASYSLVIIPPSVTLRESTIDLLGQWITDGGPVLVVGEMPMMVEGEVSDEPEGLLKDQPFVENERQAIKDAVTEFVKPRIQVLDSYGSDAITVFFQQRDLGTKQLFYLVNIDNQKNAYENAVIRMPGKGLVQEWDLDTGDIQSLPSRVISGDTVIELRFEPTQSHLICFDPDAEPILGEPERWMSVDEKPIEGPWDVERKDPNLLTVDYCRYRIGDGEWSELTHTIWMKGRLSQIEEPTQVTLQYAFRTEFAEKKPRGITLLVEQPEEYEITVNGTKIDYKDAGWYVDNSFKKIDIDSLVKQGENIVEMKCTYIGDVGRQKLQAEIDTESEWSRMWTNPPAEVKDPIIIPFDGGVADKIRRYNELKYGLEIESIYVAGDFNVYRDGQGFVLRDVVSQSPSGNLLNEGYPFFRGSVLLKKNFNYNKDGVDCVVLKLENMGAIVAKLKINGQSAGNIVWRPLELNVTALLRDGENSIEVELTNSCRNLLGPHHHKAGELFAVGPDSFMAEAGYIGWGESPGAMGAWTNNYSFVPFGLTSAPILVRENKA